MVPELLYIKLGSGSEWADECLEKGTLRIGFRDIPKKLFKSQDLDAIWRKFVELKYSKRAADIYWSQLNSFFRADQNTIWITFHQQKLWWCKAQTGYSFDSDNTKYKLVIGSWNDRDVHGNILWEDNLSGALLKTKGYLSTICVPEAQGYCLNRIYCQQSQELLKFESDLQSLKLSAIPIIRSLTWQDFEVLIDLVFRNAGFNRIGVVGRTVKTIDISLLHPLTHEKVFVQVKSTATLNAYLQWKKEVKISNSGFTSYYFAVHSPTSDLATYHEAGDSCYTLWREAEIADMVLRFGLVDWVRSKVA